MFLRFSYSLPNILVYIDRYCKIGKFVLDSKHFVLRVLLKLLHCEINKFLIHQEVDGRQIRVDQAGKGSSGRSRNYQGSQSRSYGFRGGRGGRGSYRGNL